MPTIGDLAREITETRKSKGFVTTRDNLAEKSMLVLTEVSEALDDFSDGNYTHIGEELADTVIRLLDIIDGLNLHNELANQTIPTYRLSPSMDRWTRQYMDEMATNVLSLVSKAVEAHREDKLDIVGYRMNLAVVEVCLWASELGIDLEKEIITKMGKNKNRPFKHGKKY